MQDYYLPLDSRIVHHLVASSIVRQSECDCNGESITTMKQQGNNVIGRGRLPECILDTSSNAVQPDGVQQKNIFVFCAVQFERTNFLYPVQYNMKKRILYPVQCNMKKKRIFCILCIAI